MVTVSVTMYRDVVALLLKASKRATKDRNQTKFKDTSRMMRANINREGTEFIWTAGNQ